jgi:hypothetical protein
MTKVKICPLVIVDFIFQEEYWYEEGKTYYGIYATVNNGLKIPCNIDNVFVRYDNKEDAIKYVSDRRALLQTELCN